MLLLFFTWKVPRLRSQGGYATRRVVSGYFPYPYFNFLARCVHIAPLVRQSCQLCHRPPRTFMVDFSYASIGRPRSINQNAVQGGGDSVERSGEGRSRVRCGINRRASVRASNPGFSKKMLAAMSALLWRMLPRSAGCRGKQSCSSFLPVLFLSSIRTTN